MNIAETCVEEKRRRFRRKIAGAGVGVVGVILAATSGIVAAAGSTFTEDWAGTSSAVFRFLGSTITSGVSDAGAADGRAANLTLSAWPGSGPGGGPNIQTNDLFGFGTYEARLKAANCSSQPDSGVISGFFNFLNDGTDLDGNGVKDNIEIDFEWLCAEPNVMWMTMWTDFQESPLAMKRVYRELDLATGTIRRTCYSEGYGTCTQDLTGSGSEGAPATITPISGYNSATAYYTYGFTWLSNRVTWYVLHPTSGAKIILWDYQGPTTRIAQRPAYYMLNVWHTPNWAPTNLPGAVQAPNTPRTMSLDWVRYTLAGGTPQPTVRPGGPTPTATAGGSCYPAWVSNITYATGTRVTYNGQNYQANYPTNGDNPAQHSGPAGSGQPWLTLGACTGTATPTATATTRPRATATATAISRATATPTSTSRATATSTPTVRATATPTPTSGTGCWPAWSASAVYTTGAQVSRNGQNYRAAYWTQGNDPATRSGPAGSGEPWIPMGACGAAATPTPGGTPRPTPSTVGIVFDDFNYTSDADATLIARKWTPRTYVGGPGIPGATWGGISFLNDPSISGNRLLQLAATTDGTAANTRQSELYHVQKFYEGTYAARVFFSDAPSSGSPDGDNVVETFFTITPLAFDLDPNYGETDFEYLPNGGWGVAGPILYLTTWETYRNEPWLADNINNNYSQSFAGWHDLLVQISGGVTNGTVKYYVDGVLRAEHPAKYYPETPVSVNFNLWFISGGLQGASTSRTYTQQVDYFYYTGNEVVTQATVNSRVAAYRAAGTRFVDTVPNP